MKAKHDFRFHNKTHNIDIFTADNSQLPAILQNKNVCIVRFNHVAISLVNYSIAVYLCRRLQVLDNKDNLVITSLKLYDKAPLLKEV